MFVVACGITAEKLVEELKKGSATAFAFDDVCVMLYVLCIMCYNV